MSEPRTSAEQQADTTSARVLEVLAAYEAGRIAAPDVPDLAAVALYAGKVLSSRLADIELSTRLDSPPLGIVPGPDHLERLSEAVQTVLEEPEDASERLERLAQSEVLTSYAKSLSAGIRERGYRWRENVADDACEVCQPFRNVEHEPDEAWSPHHPRCRCEPDPYGDPVTETKPEPTTRVRRVQIQKVTT
ncbi:MAG: hypothetical protein JWR35_3921 [Marmoricola sp.]|nr:hypothetical protein [Marmoricola sp.]